MRTPIELYPVAVYEDRYSGTYSDGEWVAIAGADRRSRDFWSLDCNGDDGDAAEFWRQVATAPDEFRWIAVGDTPQASIGRLIEQNR